MKASLRSVCLAAPWLAAAMACGPEREADLERLSQAATAAYDYAEGHAAQGNWWDVDPEDEVPSTEYDSILYSEIPPRLRQLETQSDRVRVEVIGKSAGGRKLFLATVSDPKSRGYFGMYRALRKLMLRDPARAQQAIDRLGHFKVPVFINAGIHGNEYPNVDAAIRLIERLAYEDSDEVQSILNNIILLVNVVQNPDGRVNGTRRNENGFDINRDFITQSQPETRATVKQLTRWNPMVLLDFHGFVNPMLIEPCTPPHNPNYEYDLYITWALAEAEAMKTAVQEQVGHTAQIPFTDGFYGYPEGWDDWPPIFVPMYAMYHGAYGHTLETPYRDERGVDALVAAAWGALEFAVQNKRGMIHDQIEVFKRGSLGEPQVPIPQQILDQTYEQYNELTTIEFPEAYVVPAKAPLQQDPHAAAALVGLLRFNGVEVHVSRSAFTLDGTRYPPGTYVIWMKQPKRGLANTVMWPGLDISSTPGLTMYDISGWSHPLLWGVTHAVMSDPVRIRTTQLKRLSVPRGRLKGGVFGPALVFAPTSNAAVIAANDILADGLPLYRSEAPFEDAGRHFGAGSFVVQTGGWKLALVAQKLKSRGIDVAMLRKVPQQATALRQPRIAVIGDEGIRFVLDSIGFAFDELSATDINSGKLAQYDVLINDDLWWSDLDATGQGALLDFIAAGGDYVGIGRNGVYLAKEAQLLDFEYTSAGRRSNGVVAIDFDPDDPVVAQYPAQGHGFVYGPLWFTDWSTELDVSATLGSDAFFVAGYWPGWEADGAAGKPVVVHGQHGPADVTLMGINPTFRAHPRHTFRILANAIFNGL